MTLRPTFNVEGPRRVRIRADSREAVEQAIAAYSEAWPDDPVPPAALDRAFASRDGRTLLTDVEAARLIPAFQRIGKPGTASELRLAVEASQRLDQVHLRGFVSKNGRGEWCYFPRYGADGIPLSGDLANVAENAPEWSVPRDSLPR